MRRREKTSAQVSYSQSSSSWYLKVSNVMLRGNLRRKRFVASVAKVIYSRLVTSAKQRPNPRSGPPQGTQQITGNRQWPFKQANHGAYSNLGTQVGGPVEGFRCCFADVLNQSFIVLSLAQAGVLARVCRQSYSKKTANIALRHQRFPLEMTFEERAQKFYTDDLHYPDMGSASAWMKICFRGRA